MSIKRVEPFIGIGNFIEKYCIGKIGISTNPFYAESMTYV